MKKISIAVLAVTLAAVCLFAGCNGAEGGKITDTQQNLSEAMSDAKDMMTDISEFFTNPSGNITDNSQASNPATNISDTNTGNITM
ncbi:MAG: hypothetical protein IJE48_09745 [Clostridia bacterium]|nr:hypothetical protein [Clostridia bacterium]